MKRTGSGLRRPRVGRALGLAGLGLLLAGSAPGLRAGAPETLPRIRVAPGGKGFVTAAGRPFVPVGVNYFRPGTGWAPQVWKKFDAAATRKDFERLRTNGFNCIRIFLTYGSFLREKGKLDAEGIAKFDQLLELAEENGIYVHPTGPDHWEGVPEWRPGGVEDAATVAVLEEFWRLFAARYRGRGALFSYDLKNEPEVGWDNAILRQRWHEWLGARFKTPENLRVAWGLTNLTAITNIAAPPNFPEAFAKPMLDFQRFREDLADEWTRRQAAAIKAADPEALVTVGLIQWSVPALLPAGPRHYSAFRPSRQARYLDFLEVHFYPLAEGAFRYQTDAEELANLAYLEAVVAAVAAEGKPVVLAEFGWYGGGAPKFLGNNATASTEEQHARYCRRAVEVTRPLAVGWLNWGMFDHPESLDCTEFIGLFTAEGTEKAWGRDFSRLAKEVTRAPAPARDLGPRPALDWDAAIIRREAGDDYRRRYLEAFKADPAAMQRARK